MKRKIKKMMKNKKLITILMEYIITIECFIMLFLLLSPQEIEAAEAKIQGVTWRYTVINEKAVNVYCEEGEGKEVTIPEKLGGYPVVSIYNPHGNGRNIFASEDNEENTVVEKIIIPEGIETIGDYAFYSCTNLQEVEIPSTVTSIGKNAFIGCTGLEKEKEVGTVQTKTVTEKLGGEEVQEEKTEQEEQVKEQTIEEEQTEVKETSKKVDGLEKYTIIDGYMTRIKPLTNYETFKAIAENTLNSNSEQTIYTVKVYQDAQKSQEVTKGYIASGMIVVGMTEEGNSVSYIISVIGDMTKDGDSNVTELTRIIKYVIGLSNWGLSKEEILAADFNGDGVVDVSDVEVCINYIVFGELKSGENTIIASPNIESAGIQNGVDNWYNSTVKVHIIENEKQENISKTETKIEAWLAGNETGETVEQTTTETVFNLEKDGIYKLSSQTYGKNGKVSQVVTKTIKIDKVAPIITTLEEVYPEDHQYAIQIKANDNIGIIGYRIQKDGEEEKVITIDEVKNINERIEITENGTYKVKIEDVAGNITEKEITILDINQGYMIEFKNEDGTTISSKTYHYGDTVEEPEAPTKEADETYTYEFAGWDKEITPVTKDEVYTATFESKYIEYTVEFKNEDGTTISSKTYHYGDTVEEPEAPTKEADETYTYEFAGWDKEITPVTKDEVYTATFESKYIEYTVEFKNEDGTTISSKTYHYEDTVEEPEAPTKPSDDTYEYEFAGWDKEITPVTKDEVYTATFESKYIEYTVEFKNEDGTTISSKTYHYGDTVEEPEEPTKPSDDTYEYEFAGWDKEITPVTKDEVYTATFESKYLEYTVEFKNEDGTTISSKTYHYGDTVEEPEEPTKPGDETYEYEFAGWDKEITPVTKDEVYTATYRNKYIEYTVEFKNEDGTTISSKTYHYGDTVEEPEAPTKPGDETYEYEFAGWDKEITPVTKDEVYTATYRNKYIEYTVEFKNEDGTTISSKTYHYGDTVEEPEAPAKEADETFTYEFAGWDKEVTKVIKDEVYTATYSKTYKEYTIEFRNEDGSSIYSKEYHYGDTVEEPEAPTKAADEMYTYEFAGWDKEITPVTKDEVYTATFESKYIEYTVEFKNEDGTTISSKTYHYGDTVEEPEAPAKEADETYTYEFAGWDKEVTPVTGNTIYTAIYESKYIEYTVTFKQYDGTIISHVVYHYGDTIVLPENPIRESTVSHAYTFIGWTPQIQETITENLEYTATYEEQEINYTILFYNDDETEVARIENYHYGDDFNFPTTPTKAPTEEIKYEFSGWKSAGMEEISKTQVNMSFIAQYKEKYFVARVEETETLEGVSYLTLEEAVENAGSSARTIRLLQDTQESVMIEDDQNITLNLNGKTITGTKNYAIKNYGVLIVTDESEEKEGKIKDIVASEIGYGIHNRDGRVTIKAGTIVTETTEEAGTTYGIYNQSEQPLVIEGGSIIAEARGKNAVSCGIYNLEGQEIDVTGGVILGNAIAENSTSYGIYNKTQGSISVTNGRIEGKSSLSSAISYGIYNEISENININGGTISVQSDKNIAYGVYNKEGKITITEGTIEVTASTGYGIYNETGTIDVQAGTITMVGTTSYGMYNKQGILNVSGGSIELLSSTSYGIYNNSQANITGGEITTKTNSGSSYGIYNNSQTSIKNANINVYGIGIDNNTGEMTITSASITAGTGIYNNSSSASTIVETVDITATSYGVNNNAGEITIKEGNIIANTYGIYNNYTGIVIIGTKDQNIHIETPTIKGATNAIYQNPTSSGKIKYYDGTLIGQMAIYGGVSEIEENSQIIIETNEEGKEVATLQPVPAENVVQIGETKYTSLAEAINAVAENAEESTMIQVITNFDVSEFVEIPENKKVTLDLAGYTITTYGKGGITNKGTLEVTDNSQEALGEIVSGIGIGINNEKDLTITKGIITSNQYGIFNSSYGNAIIQGGTIQGKKAGIYSINNVIVEGGTIEGERYGLYNYNASASIKNGSITGNSYGIYVYGGNVNIEGGNIEGSTGVYTFTGLKVTGGNITGTGYGILNDGKVTITGGTIEGNSGICNGNSSRLIIGTKDQTVEIDMPTIIGTIYGIENSTNHRGKVTVEYYDGSIAGKEKAIYGSIYDIEDGKKVQINTEVINEEEYEVASLVDEEVNENGIAQIGETIYTTVSGLKQAISKIPTNTEEPVKVTILNDFALSQEIMVATNQNIKIDLNGKAITSTAAIVNAGTLEITDETENYEGIIRNTNQTAIINSGKLTIAKGKIEGKTYGIGRIAGNIILGIKDGEVSGASVMIQGETIGVYSYYSYSIEMYDGAIKGKSSISASPITTEEGYKTYTYSENGYQITTLKVEAPAARTGGQDYDTLQAAIDACENGNTVEVLRNIDFVKETITIESGKNIVLDLKGYTVTSSLVKMLENNGTLKIANSSGTIRNTASNGITIENNGTLELVKGTTYSDNGTAVENNGTLEMKGGSITGSTYGIKNNENATLTVSSGSVTSNQAIYNNSTNTLNITGGSIYGSYGIYNNVSADIVMTGGAIYRNYSSSYLYGIYNNANGDIVIKTSNSIQITGGSYSYGIYNNAEGNVVVEKGSISAQGSYLAYGIRNTSKGSVQVEGGSITATSASGYAYGIENGSLGSLSIAGGTISATTTTGAAYGIKNMSLNLLTITGGTVKATGTQSYGVYNNTSDVRIGTNDGQITSTSPSITGDGVGVYIYEQGTKFDFYDGRIKGKESTNVDANTPEGYKLLKYYDQNEQKEIAILGEMDDYVVTYYLNGETYKSVILKAGAQIPEQIIEKTGYDFSGWSEIPEVMPEENIRITGTLTPKIYTITYYVDGEQYGEVDTFEYKSEVIPREIPEKEGYTFSGWSQIPETMPAENIEVRGVFTYTATFYNENKTSVLATVSFTINDTALQEPAVPEKEGYIGWWSDYSIQAKDIEVEAIYVEEKAVINKTKKLSYDSIETAVANVDTDGTQNEIFLTQSAEAQTITVPEDSNVILDLNGNTITNNSSYYGIDNYGTLELADSSSTQTGGLVVEKADADLYGIYNRENASATIQKGSIFVTATEGYTGIGIYNNSGASITLGINDEEVSTTTPNIQGSTYGINNSTDGRLNFYDGKIAGSTAVQGTVHEVEYGYRTVTSSQNGLQTMILSAIPNGTKLKATDENGITWNYTYQDGEATNVYYESGTLGETVKIPAVLNGHSVVSLYNGNNRTDWRNIFTHVDGGSITTIKKVIIPEGVISIGDNAFYKCSSLTSIEIPSSVTMIGNYAFYNCSSLTSIEILSSVTSIGGGAFYNCNSLTSLTVDENNSVYSSENDILYNKDKTELIQCAGGKTGEVIIPSSVTSIGDRAFYGCISLSSVEIPSSVTSIGWEAFYNCSSLTSMIIPEGVTSIKSSTFYNCNSLRSIELPSSLTSIEYNAFYNCSSLTSVQIPEGVTSIGDYAFENCSSLTNVQIPSSLNTINQRVFRGCSSLTSVVIPEGISSIGWQAFYDCSNLTDLYIDNIQSNITFNWNWTNNNVYVHYRDCKHTITINKDSREQVELKEVSNNLEEGKIACGETYQFQLVNEQGEVVKDKEIKIKSGGKFTNSAQVTEYITPNEDGIYILENVNRSKEIIIGMDSGEIARWTDENGITWEYRYENGKARALKYISGEIPDTLEVPEKIDGLVVTTMANGALTGTSVKNVILPDSIINIGQSAFENCTELETIVLPVDLQLISNSAFKRCTKLEQVELPEEVIAIGNEAFSGCRNLTMDLTFKNGIKSIGKDSFKDCISLSDKLVLPGGIVQVSSGAFKGCVGITAIEIMEYAGEEEINESRVGFSSNTDLDQSINENTNYYIPGIYNKKKSITIGGEAFSGCTSLTKIYLPAGINKVEYNTIVGCDNLTDIYIDMLEEDMLEKIEANQEVNIFVHYRNCKHLITKEVEEGLQIEEVSNNLENDMIACGETYQFKIVDEQGNIVTNKRVKVTSQGQFTNSEEVVVAITPNEKGIYTIENVNRNKTITIGIPNGTKLQATDVNGITWNYMYQDGNATNVYYKDGTLGETVEIPTNLDGLPVTSLYNSNKENSNIFAKTVGEANTTIKKVMIPESVTNVGAYAFANCSSLTDIYMHNLQSNVTLEENWNLNTNAYIHDNECKHEVAIQKDESIKIEIVSGNLDNGKITCGETYRFKLTNADGEMVTPRVAKITTQGQFTNSEEVTEELIPNEEGIYTIENVNRNKTIFITNMQDGESGTYMDAAGITWNYTYQDRKATNVYYESGELPEVVEIPATLNGYPVVSLYNSSEGYSRNIFAKINSETNTIVKQVIIPEGVTSIGDDAFYRCSSLTSVVIPDSVTSIGYNAFRYCISLTSIEIPSSVTSIGDFAFESCNSITSLTVDENNLYYSSENDMLYNKDKAELIQCAGGKTGEVIIPSSVTSIGDNAFYDCSSLTSVEIPSSVTSIGSNAFAYCSSLTSLTVDENNPNYSSKNDILYNKDKTELIQCAGGRTGEVIIPEGVTIIRGLAFRECRSLTSIVIPSSITRIEWNQFSDCSSLTSIVIPESVTSIRNNAFWSCSSLKSITIPSSVTSIGSYVFANCFKLEDIYIDNIESNITLANNWSWYTAYVHYRDCQHTIITENLEEGISLKVVSGNIVDGKIPCKETYQFQLVNEQGEVVKDKEVRIKSQGQSTHSEEVTEKIYPNEEGIYTIENINRNKTIVVGCINGEQLQATDAAGITWNYTYEDKKATNVYYESGTLGETVEIPATLDGHPVVSLHNSSVSYMINIFTNANNGTNTTVKQVILPSSVTTIGSSAFYNCSSLTSVEIPNSVTSIGSAAFDNCSSLTSIEIPEGVTRIGSGAFLGCSSLTSVNIPSSVTIIGESAFNRCSSLTSIKIPEGVTGIGFQAFLCCSSLTSVEIPSSVTSIGANAFYGCSSLTSVNIPNSVISIESCAFYSCGSLTDIYIDNLESNITFENSWKYGTNAYVHYRDCKHTITQNLEEGISIEVVSGNIANGQIPCGETYKFKVVNEAGEVVNDKRVKVISQGEFTTSEQKGKWISANEEGIYTIENINRDKTLMIGEMQNGDIAEITDSNGITWEYQYEDGKARALKYVSGEIPETLEVPAKIDNLIITTMANEALKGTNIKHVILPDSIINIGKGAFENCTSLETIVLPVDLQFISSSAFKGCMNLTQVELPESLIVIGDKAFSGCSNLRMDLALKSEIKAIGKEAFKDCTGLEGRLILPGAIVKIGGNAFGGCTGITEVEFLAYTGEEEVDESRFSFYWNSSYGENIIENTSSYGNTGIATNEVNITNVIIDENGNKVTEDFLINVTHKDITIGGQAFSGCTNLTKLYLPEGVRKIHYEKDAGFDNLVDIYIDMPREEMYEDVNTYGQVNVHYRNCMHIIDISGSELLKGIRVQSVLGELQDGKIVCEETYTFKLVDEQGQTVTDKLVRIKRVKQDISEAEIMTPNEEGIYTIENVKSDKEISVGTANGEKLQVTDENGVTWNFTYQDGNATNVYYESGELSERVIIPDTLNECPVVSLYNNHDRNIFVKNDFEANTTVKEVIIPGRVTSIGESAFYNCSSLTSVNIPSSVTSIGDWAFAYCSSLTSIEIPSSVTSIGESTFQDCWNLTDIYIDNLQSNITFGSSFGNAYVHYSDCKHTITISNDPRKQVEFQEVSNNLEEGKIACRETYQFQLLNEQGEVVKDKEVRIKSQDSAQATEYITPNEDGIYTLENVNRNKKIIIGMENGETAQVIDESGVTWEYTYEDGKARALKYISGEIPETLEVPEKIDGLVVTTMANEALKGMNVKHVILPDSIINIGYSAFENCTELETIVLPVDLQFISDLAFKGCTKLTQVELPEDLIVIGNEAFSGCSDLSMVLTFKDGIKAMGRESFKDCISLSGKLVLPGGIVQISSGAFKGCTGITVVEILSYTGDEEIDESTVGFSGSGNYSESVNESTSSYVNTGIGEIIEWRPVKDENGEDVKDQFGNTITEKIVLGTKKNITIGGEAFSGCTSLAEIYLPAGVNKVEYSTIAGCENLTDLYIDTPREDMLEEVETNGEVTVHYRGE